jgi:uncharacterized protein
VKHPPEPLVVDVGDLLDRPNTRRPIEHRVVLDGEMAVAGSRLDAGGGVDVALVLESMPSAIAVNGTVGFAWVGECRRCLDEVRGVARAEVHEVYEARPTPDETFPIEHDQIDLEPIVREAVLLGLPLAPLCGDDCRGPAPETFPALKPGELGASDRAEGEPPGDPRWAALDDLRFDES